MPTWTNADLDTIGADDEIDVAPRRRDGTLGRFVTIWGVGVGDEVFVRLFHGPPVTGIGPPRPPAAAGSASAASNATSPSNRLPTPMQSPSTLRTAKYGSSSYVDAMVTRTATAAALRIVPNATTRSNHDRDRRRGAVRCRADVR
jgi:Uncharacterized protein conserved in bacteria (DUF2255)